MHSVLRGRHRGLNRPFAEQTTPERGIEPPSSGLEAVVLPLDDSGILLEFSRERKERATGFEPA